MILKYGIVTRIMQFDLWNIYVKYRVSVSKLQFFAFSLWPHLLPYVYFILVVIILKSISSTDLEGSIRTDNAVEVIGIS